MNASLAAQGAFLWEWGASDAQPVVAVHSAGLDGRSFRGLAEALPEHRILALDLRGHGRSSADTEVSLDGMVADVIALGERTEGPPALLGTSLGGVIAGLAAAARPELWASLTVVCTPDRGAPAFLERAEAVERGGMGAVIEDTLERWFSSEALDADTAAVRYARDCLKRFDPAVWTALWRDFARFDGFSALPPSLPLTVVAGAADRSTPPAVLERVSAALSGSAAAPAVEPAPGRGAPPAVRLIAEGTHQLLLERPADFATVWLNGR